MLNAVNGSERGNMNKLPESKVFQFAAFGAASSIVTTGCGFNGDIFFSQ